MNRLEKRSEALGEDTDLYTLYIICLDLRMSFNGSSDPLEPELRERYINYLKTVLATWEPSNRNTLEYLFDESVKDIVQATLALYEHYKGKGLL